MTRTLQHGLFESEEVRLARESSASRKERWQAYLKNLATQPDALDTKIGIIRGFLALHFREDPRVFLDRPLLCLGGRTLKTLCEHHWDQAHAWMMEVKLNLPDRDFYIAAFEESAKIEENTHA